MWQIISQLKDQNPTNAPFSTSFPLESGYRKIKH
jgi:hypothetical protein